MAISIASRKAKARVLQQKIRDLILKLFPQLEPDDVRSAPMGTNGPDIVLSPAARKVWGYQVEAKKRKTSAIHTDYAQARTHGGAEPLLVIQKDRDIPLAIVSLDHFMALVERAL